MEELTHNELLVALKEMPDYEAYADMPRWPLFDSACLIIEEWPDKEARKYWSQTVKDRFNDAYKPMLSDILAGRLTAEKVDDDYWITKEHVINWAEANHLPVGSRGTEDMSCLTTNALPWRRTSRSIFAIPAVPGSVVPTRTPTGC